MDLRGAISEVIGKHLPGRSVRTIVEKGTWIQQVFEVSLDNDESVILKVKVHPEWGDPREEAMKCEFLRAHGLPAPRVFAVDDTKEDIPYSFAIQEKMHGTRLGTLLKQASEKDITRIYEALGRTYRKMHNIHNSRSGLMGDSPREILYPVSPNEYMYRAEIVGGSGKKALEQGLISVKTYDRMVMLWADNMEYLKNHQPSLIHNSAFLWTISLTKTEGRWEVTKLTALSDILWWDPSYDVALIRNPPFSNITPGCWDAFIQGYGQPPEIKRITLYSLMHTVCAVMGVYMEPKSFYNKEWVETALNNLNLLVDELAMK